MTKPDLSCILKFAMVGKTFLWTIQKIHMRRAAALALVDVKILICDARIAMSWANEKWSSMAKRPTRR